MATTGEVGARPKIGGKSKTAAPPRKNFEAEPRGKSLRVVKVAIVGGGMAGMSTAWELCRQNEAKNASECYEITVYERSARLGGKGASTRDDEGRILEHGLHVWLGFYENAFAIMRECYSEVAMRGWGPDGKVGEILPHGSFDEAFIPEPHIGVASRRRSGDLEVWSGMLPLMKGQPGEPLDVDTNPFTLWAYLARCLGLVRALMQSMLAPAQGEAAPGDPRPDGRSTSDEAQELDFSFDALRSPSVLLDHMVRMMRVGVLASTAGLLQGVTIFESWLRERNPAPQSSRTILKFVEALAAQTRKQLRDFVAIDEEVRRKTEIIDIVMTVLVGLYRDKVFFSDKGLDAINHIDYRKWLMDHGATKTSLESPFITGIYDLVFAYRNGDRKRPALAAGQALRGALRMFFSYRGAMFWRMASGMGDAVFAPLYKVLADKGVKFRFCHELKQIKFAEVPTGKIVRSVRFRVNDDVGDPLDRFGCWPNAPRTPREPVAFTLSYDDSEDGSGNSRTSFDAVVFATGIEPLEKAAGAELRKVLPSKWDAMCKHVKTVATQSAQVWLSKDLQQLGWNRGTVIVSSLGAPFETWADMTRTLASEQAHRRNAAKTPAPANRQPRSVAYFCGVLADKVAADKAPDVVKANARAMLEENLKPIWPAAYKAASNGKKALTPLDAVVDPNGKKPPGPDNFDAQHFKANIEGSDRYTQSLPGSIEFRISPLDPTVLNMTLAGDWTDCGFNAGCIEAAAMSGRLAAHAISGKPDLDAIVGYHHP